MPAFTYTALDASGKQVSGDVSVRSKAEAYRQLEAKSLVPIRVAPAGDDSAKPAKTLGKTAPEGPIKLNKTQLITFTEELADLLDAGVQLEGALRILNERQQNLAIKTIAGRIREDIREGAKFSASLKKVSPSFDDLYRNLVAAGEASGSLNDILHRLAINQKQMYDLQRKVTGALIYPAVLVLACIVLMFVFTVVLMPKLTDLITQGGQELSGLTLALIKFTDFMGAWWWLILLLAAGSFTLFRAYIATAGGREWWDRFKFKVALFGPVVAGRFYAQFCHTLSNLTQNGIPLLNSMKLIARGTTNVFLKKHLENAVEEIGDGTSLARALGQSKAFPLELIDRIAIGEQTGELGKAFTKAARKYDEDLGVRIGRLTGLVPIVILCLMGVFVGTVAYAIMTTIFGSVSGIRG